MNKLILKTISKSYIIIVTETKARVDIAIRRVFNRYKGEC